MPGLQWVLKPRSVVTPTGSIKLASHGWSALFALLNHTTNPPRVSLPPPRQSPQRPLAHYNARSQLGQKEIIWVMNRITQPLDRQRYPHCTIAQAEAPPYWASLSQLHGVALWHGHLRCMEKKSREYCEISSVELLMEIVLQSGLNLPWKSWRYNPTHQTALRHGV